jgi:hypothetical protein
MALASAGSRSPPLAQSVETSGVVGLFFASLLMIPTLFVQSLTFLYRSQRLMQLEDEESYVNLDILFKYAFLNLVYLQ